MALSLNEAWNLTVSTILDTDYPYGTKAELARHIGVGPAYLSDLLAGRRNWTEIKRMAVADFFELSHSELWGMAESELFP